MAGLFVYKFTVQRLKSQMKATMNRMVNENFDIQTLGTISSYYWTIVSFIYFVSGAYSNVGILIRPIEYHFYQNSVQDRTAFSKRKFPTPNRFQDKPLKTKEIQKAKGEASDCVVAWSFLGQLK